jgi:hypothetical protein
MADSLEDKLVRRFMADPQKAEVRSWLRGGVDEQRTLGQLSTTADSLAFAEEIYDAGADEVMAVDMRSYTKTFVEGDERVVNSGKLIVRLPTDAARRKTFFRWENKHARSLGFDGRNDVGQGLLFVPLD